MRLLLRTLDHPRLRWIAVALAVLLAAPALGAGFGADDWFQRAHLDPSGSFLPAGRGPLLDLFAFFPEGGVPDMVDRGLLPWWTQADIRGAFLRPLTALTHGFDWRVFGDLPVLHHLHSLLWVAVMVLAAHAFFVEWLGAGRRAALATLLFAIDDSHAWPSAWVANRNALLAMAFGALAGRAHLRARRGGSAFVAAGWLAAALFSAEAGTATLAVLAALELGHREPLAARVRRLLPLAGATAVWAAVWTGYGFGMHGSGLYVDPLKSPATFLTNLPGRLGALEAAAWLNAPVDGWVMLPPRVGAAVGLALLLVSALVVAALLRRSWATDPVPRQAVLLATLALIPPTGAFPMTRVVGLAGLGVAAALATAILPSLEGPVRKRDRLALAWHLPIAALMLVGQASALGFVLRGASASASAVDAAGDVGGRTLVFTSGHEVFSAYIPVVRHYHGLSEPAAMITVAPAATAVRLTREDDRTLRVDAKTPAFSGAMERLSREAPFVTGERMHTATLDAEVIEAAADGSLLAWRLRFPASLDDPRYVWCTPDGLSWLPFTPPEVGESVDLPAAFALPVLPARPGGDP